MDCETFLKDSLPTALVPHFFQFALDPSASPPTYPWRPPLAVASQTVHSERPGGPQQQIRHGHPFSPSPTFMTLLHLFSGTLNQWGAPGITSVSSILIYTPSSVMAWGAICVLLAPKCIFPAQNPPPNSKLECLTASVNTSNGISIRHVSTLRSLGDTAGGNYGDRGEGRARMRQRVAELALPAPRPISWEHLQICLRTRL